MTIQNTDTAAASRRHPRLRAAVTGAALLVGLLAAAVPAAAADTDGTRAAPGLNNTAAAPVRAPSTIAAALTDSRYAVVSSAGTLARSRNAVSATRFGEFGLYEVVFDRNITGCAYLAGMGNTGIGNPVAGFASVAQRSGNPNAVFINTFAVNGVTTPASFHLEVVC